MTHATNNEALAEFARNAGRMAPDRAWLLSEWDVWVANPFYDGPAVPHPEDDSAYCDESDEDEDEEYEIDCDDSDDGYALAAAGFGTDEDYNHYDYGDY